MPVADYGSYLSPIALLVKEVTEYIISSLLPDSQIKSTTEDTYPHTALTVGMKRKDMIA